MSQIKSNIPKPCPRMQSLPVDGRGYPVPWFVQWIDGKPDHRVMDASKLKDAVRKRLCWMCGQTIQGEPHSFCIGPMCAITRGISEPHSHMECLRYAVRVCPFLTNPDMRRRAGGIPEDAEMAGVPILRNPGVSCLWTTNSYKVFGAGTGLMFELGAPVQTEWYCQGRHATHAEVLASINSGLPALFDIARAEDAERSAGAVNELQLRVNALRSMLNVYRWPDEPKEDPL